MSKSVGVRFVKVRNTSGRTIRAGETVSLDARTLNDPEPKLASIPLPHLDEIRTAVGVDKFESELIQLYTDMAVSKKKAKKKKKREKYRQRRREKKRCTEAATSPRSLLCGTPEDIDPICTDERAKVLERIVAERLAEDPDYYARPDEWEQKFDESRSFGSPKEYQSNIRNVSLRYSRLFY